MILTYDEALQKSSNPEWFKSIYKKDEIASDSEVLEINNLVKEVGEEALFDYFSIKEDLFIQKEYVLDLIDYLEDLKK